MLTDPFLIITVRAVNGMRGATVLTITLAMIDSLYHQSWFIGLDFVVKAHVGIFV